MKHETGRSLALAVVAVMAFAADAVGQGVESPGAALDRLFDGMRSADSAMVRSVLAPDVRFAVLDARQEPVSIRVQPVDGWLAGVAGSGGSWDEQTYEVHVDVDGPMASVWAPYTFYLDGTISHCGVNSIELLRDAEGWRVTQISDTRRRESCPDPHGFDGG